MIKGKLHTQPNMIDRFSLMAKRIKDTYQKHLWRFLSANIVIYFIVSAIGFFDVKVADSKISEFLNPKSFVFILSPILSLVLNGFLPNSFKEFLVFWKIKNRLPGCRAFSKFAISDYRVDVNKLKIKVGRFPDAPQDQNRVWYKLYSDLQENKVVKGSHRDFLLTRDLCAISFLFAIFIFPIEVYLLEDFRIIIGYTIFLLVQYLALSLAARNYGNRFVCNVLSIAVNATN